MRRAVQAALDAGANPVIVVLGSDEEKVRAAIAGMANVSTCVNPDWKTGLSSSIKSGLDCITHNANVDGVLVTLSDQPRVTAPVLRKLTESFVAGHRLVAAAYDGVIGVPAIFGKEFLEELSGLSGDFGAGGWLRARGNDVRSIPMTDASFDVDTPMDIAKLKDKPAAGRADYGIDAPVVVRNFIVLTIALLVVGFAIRARPVWGSVQFGPNIPRTFLIMGLWFGATATVMLWGSRFGKMQLRDRILESLNMTGSEQVLDVGCGHGLMLIGAAKRLTTGKAFGIDIWNSVDQSGNSVDATLRNGRAEGVEDRIDLRDGDARAIPFPDSTFDIVLSSWVIHNMKSPDDRSKSLDEIVRVLKPGGLVAITDISHARDYARQLEAKGLMDVLVSPPNFLFVIPSHTVSATKREII